MIRIPRPKILGTTLILAAFAVFVRPVAAAPTDQTLKNLQTAYATESREHLLYLEFAKKADQEGYAEIASLFRAVARAEEIHAQRKADLITALGGTAATDPQALVVRTTRDNLRDAMKDEAYESDMLYAGFAKRARKENLPEAEQVFRLEHAVEPQHRRLFEDALLHLEDFRDRNAAFAVCPVCGYLDSALPDHVCPNCQTPVEKFEWVK
jgi:rubrerythrin